jgi:hypothetical protein
LIAVGTNTQTLVNSSLASGAIRGFILCHPAKDLPLSINPDTLTSIPMGSPYATVN